MTRMLIILALIAATGMLVWRPNSMASSDRQRGYVVTSSPAARLPRCVEPTSYMRRHHMDLLRHQQVRTVHKGERSARYSLAGCVVCHAGIEHGQAVPVNQADQFCAACHAYVAVAPDCFSCHSPVPRALEAPAVPRKER